MRLGGSGKRERAAANEKSYVGACRSYFNYEFKIGVSVYERYQECTGRALSRRGLVGDEVFLVEPKRAMVIGQPSVITYDPNAQLAFRRLAESRRTNGR